MIQDKVIQEVRRIRESIAERNDFDVRKIVEDVTRREAYPPGKLPLALFPVVG